MQGTRGAERPAMFTIKTGCQPYHKSKYQKLMGKYRERGKGGNKREEESNVQCRNDKKAS